MSALKVTVWDMRTSFTWTRCHLDILLDPQAESRLNFLGRRFLYEEAFDAAAMPGSAPHGLDRPWVVPPGQPFWSHYLEGARLPNVTAKQAWRALVPFRKRLSAKITSSAWPVRIVPHGFFYPHGVGLVLDVTYKGVLKFEAAVDNLQRLVGSPCLDVELAGNKSKDIGLDDVANLLMDGLSSDLLEKAFAPSEGAGDAFSVVTFVKAVGDTLPSPADDGDLHKALEGLVFWNPYWRKTTPTDLGKVTLPLEQAPQNHALFRSPRGRAVWFPEDFVPASGPQTALGTFHKDLVVTGLQVESLCGFLAKTEAYLSEGNPTLQAVHGDCARIVAGLLGRLYGETQGFTSSSPRFQMDQNRYVPVVNQMRKRFRMPDLHAP